MNMFSEVSETRKYKVFSTVFRPRFLFVSLLISCLMFFSLAGSAHQSIETDTDIDRIYVAPLNPVARDKVLRKFATLYHKPVHTLVALHEYDTYGRQYEVIFNPTLVKLNDQHVCRFNVFKLFYSRAGHREFVYKGRWKGHHTYWSHPFDAGTDQSAESLCTEDKIEIKVEDLFTAETFAAAYKVYESILPYLSCWHHAPMQVEDMEKGLLKREVLGAAWKETLQIQGEKMYVFGLLFPREESWPAYWAQERKRDATPVPLDLAIGGHPYPYKLYATLDGKQASYWGGGLRILPQPIEKLKCDKDQAKRRQQPYPQ